MYEYLFSLNSSLLRKPTLHLAFQVGLSYLRDNSKHPFVCESWGPLNSR